MGSPTTVVWLHPAAPPKPAAGAACNGCGVCCAAAPCPLGMLLSGRVRGACRQLQWHEAHGAPGHYRCGVLAGARPGWRARLVARWIGAGGGCDCHLAAMPG